MSGPGEQLMNDSQALLVRQKLDKLEIFCPALQKRNKYKIVALANADDPDFNGQWDDKKFKSLPHVMSAKEESDFLCRCCCMNNREFNMDITAEQPGADPVVFKFFRPFKCSIFCCCMLINPQEIQVNDGAGSPLGVVTQDFRCMPACCGKFYWKVADASGADQYLIEDNRCCNANMFAPSCCCPVHHFDIYAGSEPGDPVGSIENIFPGCNLRACAQTDSYKLNFPSGATANQKALLLGGLMLLEYMLFEKSSEDDA